jgi:hypothetical protein
MAYQKEVTMNRDIDQLRHSRSAIEAPRPTPKSPRPLTHDEKKAAEAAFQHLPYNPEWSDSALRVYVGIVDAIERLKSHSVHSDAGWESAA